MSIGERIIALRKEQNLSQLQIAEALDVSRQAVSKWENDLSSPDTIRLIQLADLLNTDVEYLATGKHQNEPDPKIITVVQNVDRIVEKVVEVEKPIEIEKIVETIVEVPVVKKVVRVKFKRNYPEYILLGAACFFVGLFIGLIFQ